MKKKFIYLFAMLFVAGSFVACSSSNDDDKSTVTGTWEMPRTDGVAIEIVTNDKASQMFLEDDLGNIKALTGALGTFLGNMLQSVTFDKGDIKASYNGDFSIEGKTDAEIAAYIMGYIFNSQKIENWIDSPSGLVSYKFKSNNVLALTLNIDAISQEANIDNSTRDILKEVFAKPIELKYLPKSEDELFVYLDKSTINSIFETVGFSEDMLRALHPSILKAVGIYMPILKGYGIDLSTPEIMIQNYNGIESLRAGIILTQGKVEE